MIAQGLAAPHVMANKLTRHDPEPYRMFRHIKYLGKIIADTISTPNSRLIVNMGPRMGKSELISRWTPAWFLALDPSKRVLIATNTGDLARMYGGKVRDVLSEHASLGVKITSDTSAKDDWETDVGGGMRAVGVEQSVMGRGANLLIIDDPYASWAEGQSGATRRKVLEWYQATANSRLEPGASVIILHHRMHTDDLTGKLLAGEDGKIWRQVSLPSIAGPNDPMGREPGEALCPERFSATELEAKRIAMQWSFDALHQQQPRKVKAGAAYSHFSAEPYPTGNVDHTIELRPDLPLQISVDFNINPGMHVYLGQFDPIADALTCTHEIHGPGMSVQMAMAALDRLIASLPHKWKEVEIYGDSANPRAITTGVTGYQIIVEALARMGLESSMRVPKNHPAVVDRLNVMNYALRDANGPDGHGAVRYRVHPRCERLIRDFASVQMDSKGAIDKSDLDLTHGSDAEGYRVWRLRGMRIELPKGRYGV